MSFWPRGQEPEDIIASLLRCGEEPGLLPMSPQAHVVAVGGRGGGRPSPGRCVLAEPGTERSPCWFADEETDGGIWQSGAPRLHPQAPLPHRLGG